MNTRRAYLSALIIAITWNKTVLVYLLAGSQLHRSIPVQMLLIPLSGPRYPQTWLIIIQCYISLFLQWRAYAFAIDSARSRDPARFLLANCTAKTQLAIYAARHVWRLYAPPAPPTPHRTNHSNLFEIRTSRARLQSKSAVCAGNAAAPYLFIFFCNVPFHATSLAVDSEIIFQTSIILSVKLILLGAAILSFKIVVTSRRPVMGLINGWLVAGRP